MRARARTLKGRLGGAAARLSPSPKVLAIQPSGGTVKHYLKVASYMLVNKAAAKDPVTLPATKKLD